MINIRTKSYIQKKVLKKNRKKILLKHNFLKLQSGIAVSIHSVHKSTSQQKIFSFTSPFCYSLQTTVFILCIFYVIKWYKTKNTKHLYT